MTIPSTLATRDSAAERPLAFSSEWYQMLCGVLGEGLCSELGIYALPSDIYLSVVIPVFNERATIRSIVERVCAVPIRKEVILVNDCSTDGTHDIMTSLEREGSPDNSIVVLRHGRNRGKGAALRTGFAVARGDIVVIQDADLEYDPAEYLRLIRPIVEGQADVVYGSRFMGERPHRVLYFWHSVGNKLLTMLSNCFTNLNLTDMETCYKVFRREVIERIGPELRQERFGIEPELTARVSQHGYRIFEIGISYSGRTYKEGKKIGWKDAIKAIWCIIRYGLAA